MVSPSKAKLSRIAGQQQQQLTQEEQQQQQQLPSQASQRKSNNKVQLVKGSKPLVYHRFYLDIEQHQVATKIETTIKQLGGSIEFFLNKDITHFITDKLQQGEHLSNANAAGETGERKDLLLPAVASPSPGITTARRFPSVPSPATATGSSLLQQPRQQQQHQSQRSSRQLLHLTHQQQTHGQYVNDYESATSRTSSPCPPPITSSTRTTAPSSAAAACITTSRGAASVQKQQQVVLGPEPASSTAALVGFDGKVKPLHLTSNSLPTAAAAPRSRADAMLQRVRQQQQQQQQTQYSQQPSYGVLHSSPLNPTTSGLTYGSTPTKVSTPSPFQSSSHHKQLPSPSYSPAGAGVGPLGTGTRTAAAPRQNSPVQLVRSWGTLIWSAEYALKFLRKVLASLPNENGSKRSRSGVGSTDVAAGGRQHRHRHHHGSSSTRPSQHVHHLRGPFIKIECLSAPSNYRPVYKEFKRWPVLLRNGKDLAGKKSPFADVNEPTPTPERKQLDERAAGGKGNGLETVVTQATVEGTSTNRMTRKLSSTISNATAARTGSTTTGKNAETVVKKRPQEKPAAAPPRDCGYCEICRIEYDSLAVHVQSESHQAFVQNDDNFVSLDRLLDSFGGGGGGGGEGGDDTRLADGYDTEEGAVAVEAFFQQLQNATRVKRVADEEPFERRRVSAHQPKALAKGKQERKERQEEKEQKGQQRTTTSTTTTTTTVTVAVTTTTTAAADELIERQKTPIGDRTIKEEAVAEVKQEQPQTQPTAHEEESNATKDGNEQRLLKCKQKSKRAQVKRKFDGDHSEREQCERLDSALRQRSTAHGSDGDGDKQDSSDCGNTTQELIKLALKSVIASFDCSDSEFLEDVERTLDDSVRLDESGLQCTGDSVKEQQLDKCSHNSKLGESDSNKRAANSSSNNNLTNRDSDSKQQQQQQQGQRTTRTRACKRQTDVVCAVSRGERRSSRVVLPAAAAVPVSSAFREVTGTLEHLTEASSEGMFGRRSAIHHHPHNQLNHHNHQKHKSTLSALLLKQQQERDQQQHLLDLQEQNRVPKSAGSGPEWEEEHEATDSGTVDHAAGMKVLTEFRKQRADDELNPDKTVLLVEPVARSAVIAAPIDVTVANEKLGILESSAVIKPTTVVGNRRKRNPRPAQQEDAMGLKASTIAMNNKHHHHHTHVAHLTDGVGATGGAVGTKTRHATELAATLLECDGLDPKNTKRISLGLRQNPKRANLNEDFTSLLDETLERSKTSNNSASTKRAAQPRVRGPAKGKEQTVTKQQSSKVNDEKPNRGCDEVEEKEQKHETLEHDRLTGVTAGVATSTKRTTGTMVSKKAAALEDIKVRGIRWRAPSPTTRPPVKSPLLYKVIDHQAGEEPISTCEELNERLTTTSSRSAAMGPGSHTSRKESSTAVGGGTNTQSASNQPRSSKSSTTGKPSGSSPGKKNGLIVKIRRVRQSELSLLNDEAENFMFPRKDDSSSDEDTDDDRQTSSEGFHAAGGNNFSIDLASSSEGDRGVTTIKKEADRHSEAEQQHVSLSEEKQQQTADSTGGGSRKRKKATAATATRAASPLGSDHLSSPTTQTSPLKSDDSASVGPVLKRARLEPSGRRKGQKHTADYEKGQDPAGSRMRFPAAPIQPSTTVAVTKVLPVSSNDRLRRRRSQSSASEDKGHEEKHADEAAEAKASDDDEEDVEAEKKEEHKGKRRKGGVRGRRVQRKPDRDEDAVVTSSTAVPLPTILCISCVARSYRGRGRGRGGVAGRRGRRGGVGRGGRRANRLQPGSSSCTCHLLDASRMPPPSSRRRNNESVERAGTPVSQRSTGTRASKTKTTPPNAAAPSSSSALAAAASSIMGSNSMCGSYIKGKEDGMGAVFKWINFRKRCEEIEPYRFAFERVPSLEPWYETFQRQDDGTEKVYEYFGSTGYRKLPYEMGPLPALGQNCCILNYKVIASRKSNRTASLQSSSSVSMEPASPSGSKSKPGSRLSTSEVQNITSSGSGSNSASAVNEPDGKKSSPSSSLSSLPLKKRKLLLQEGAGHSGSSVKADGTTGIIEGTSHSSRIARLIAGGSERPRKSPREHASTLAILSLLQQQQHRKRAGTIKILTSPKKATTATATQTTTLHEQLLHQDADSNGEELSRSCSRASERGSSRAGSSTGGIKFDRPLFPDSSYVNSRTLCLELDAFLSDELKRIAGEGAPSTLDGIVKKELSECIEAEDERELLADGTLVQSKPDCPTHDHPAGELFDELDQELLPPASVVQEGIAIERNGLSVSKRDLLDVLQTVGTEPPLSLKLVQRCETVVKKIVQYDRKERSMLASGTGSGLAISSASPVIGLQLFDSGSSLATCGPGSGVGSVGGSFLKKRINRTGWPTNKRKIGTRTRQQSRFMLPAAKKSLSRESVKKEEPEEGVEEEEIKDEIDDVSRQCVLKSHDDDEDTDVEDDNEAEDGEAGEEEEEDGGEVVVAGRDEPEDDEDDADTIVEQKVEVNPARCMPRKDVAQATINEKTDCMRRKQPDSKQEKQGSMANRAGLRKLVERKRRKRSFGKQHETHKASVSKREHISKVSCKEQTDGGGEQKKEDLEAKDATNRLNAQESLHEQGCEKERHPIAYDSMPTLRAALMRDNSQLQRNMASSMLLPSSPSKSSFLNPSSSAELLERGSLRQSSAGLAPGSLNRGTVPHSTGREAPAVDCESLLCPASSPGSGTGPLLGANCCKYVTKTTTTMTRVDYDGGGNVTSSGLPPLKLKHSREDVSTNNEEEEQQHSHREDNRQKQSGATNRYRGATASSTLVGSAALTATHDSDDKECDSISSRSIFVSDDCDTTSSSTAINPPDDRPPSTGELPSVSTGHANHLHHTEPVVATNAHSSDVTSPSSLPTNPRLLSNARVRRKESSGNEESIPNEAESTHNNELPSEKYMLVDALTKSPRTPSERIRNKMVKNRRVAIRMELATVAKKKQDAAKTHDDVVPPSKRRKSSSLGPPLPPPTVMPLSPPLTTSTSSSSSSSYGADDKAPLSPVGVVTSVRRKTHTDDRIIGEELLQDEQSLQHSSSANSGKVTENSAGIVLTPSKIKTRSSTFGHSPPKRTYGGAKLSLKKLPFVSLIKTTFVPDGGTTDKACTLVNGTQSLCTKNANKSNRRRKSVDKKTGNKSSPSVKKVLKKRQEPKQNVTMAKKKQIKPVTGGVGSKRNKKLSARSKKIGARKKLQKRVEDVVSSGHFNNNSGAITNDGLEHQEEEDPLGTANERENSVEQHHTDEERNHRQHHHHTTTRVHDLMEEHLIEEEEEEEEEELLKRNAVVEEEDEEDLDGVDEEEHYELLELMEVEEQAEEADEEDEMGDVADEEEEEEDAHQAEEEEEEEEEAEEEEDALLTGEDEVAERQQRQQKRQDDEERKLIMADHDYSDQHVDPTLADAEFVEVEELEEDDLESDEEDDLGEEEEAEEEQTEEDEAEDEDVDDEDDVEGNPLTATHPCRVTVAPSALSFGKQQRLKLTFASSSGASSTLAIDSATSTTVAAGTSASTAAKTFTTANSSSPTKYSPRKLRKPRGRWYRER